MRLLESASSQPRKSTISAEVGGTFALPYMLPMMRLGSSCLPRQTIITWASAAKAVSASFSRISSSLTRCRALFSP